MNEQMCAYVLVHYYEIDKSMTTRYVPHVIGFGIGWLLVFFSYLYVCISSFICMWNVHCICALIEMQDKDELCKVRVWLHHIYAKVINHRDTVL